MNMVQAYFERTKNYSALRFIVEMSLISMPFKVLMGVFVSIIESLSETSLGGDTTGAIDRGDPLSLFIIAVVFTPILETFIGQWFPILIVKIFTKKVFHVITWSSLLFAMQHLHVGIGGLLYTFPIAITLAWSFWYYRSHSFSKAYWMTTAVHALHNAIAVSFYFTL